jgi:hypothetical protein
MPARTPAGVRHVASDAARCVADAGTSPAVRRRPGRERAFAVITVIGALAIALFVAEQVLRWQRAAIERSDRLDPGMFEFDAELGWRLRAGFTGRHRHHDFDVAYTIGDDGLRRTLPAAAAGADPALAATPTGTGAAATPHERRGPPAAVDAGAGVGEPHPAPAMAPPLRVIAIVGDSFTFGQGVNDADTFASGLAVRLGPRARVLNFGVPGTSTDQHLLVVRTHVVRHRPTDLVLVVYVGNDLFDNLLARPMQGFRAKPRFRLVGGALVRDERSLEVASSGESEGATPTLARMVLGDTPPPDDWLSSLRSLEIGRRLGVPAPSPRIDDAAFAARFAPALELFRALLAAIDEAVTGGGARLHVAVLAGRSHALEPGSLSGRFQEFMRARIVEAGWRGRPVIDLASELRARATEPGTDLFHPYDGHLTPQGNAVVADLLAAAMDPPGTGARVATAGRRP